MVEYPVSPSWTRAPSTGIPKSLSNDNHLVERVP